jgi:hypothetical protein
MQQHLAPQRLPAPLPMCACARVRMASTRTRMPAMGSVSHTDMHNVHACARVCKCAARVRTEEMAEDFEEHCIRRAINLQDTFRVCSVSRSAPWSLLVNLYTGKLIYRGSL